MLQIMVLIFILAGKYTHYRAECSSLHAKNTFLCMRLNHLRGPTPQVLIGMDDSQGTINVNKIRAFLAIDTEDHLFAKIRELQDIIVHVKDDLKLVLPENVHITLEFLGNIHEAMVDEIFRIMQEIELSPFNLEFKGLGCFPSPKFIRVVWIGTGDGGDKVISLTEELKKRLKSLGIRTTTKRFTPHATIARVKSKRNTRDLARSIQELSDTEIGKMMVTSFKLKKSVLTPKGPIYTDLKTRHLSSPE